MSDAVQETWTYLGQRAQQGKRFYCWADGEGDERWYSKMPASLVGGRYTLDVVRDGERVQVYAKSVEYTGERLDQDARAGAEAAHAAAGVLLAAKTLERRHARDSALEDALEPLQRIARTLPTGPERDAFVAHVIRRLTWGL